MILAGQPIDGMFVGPVAGLAIALAVLWRFATGKILPRNTVPREDLEAVLKINAANASALANLTVAVDALVNLQRQNGRR